MASVKIKNNNKNNRISLPDNRSLHSSAKSSHDLLFKQHQQFPELITPPEESLQHITEGGQVKHHDINGTSIPTNTAQRPTTPPLPPRPRSRTVHVVPGFREELLPPVAIPQLTLSKGNGGCSYSLSSSESSSATTLVSPQQQQLPQQRRISPSIPCQYPNMQHFDRLPPHIKTFPSHHRRTLRAIAGCQGRLATASHSIKAWEHAIDRPNATISLTPSTDSAGADRVNSLAYTLSGHYLWAGLDDGYVVVMDVKQHQQQQKSSPLSLILNNKIIAEVHQHESAVKHILRIDNNELWTIDDNKGELLRWPLMHEFDHFDSKSIMPVSGRHRVTPKSISAVILRGGIGRQQQHHHVLAMTAGDTIDVYRFVPLYSSTMPQGPEVHMPYRVVRPSNDLGPITQLVALPRGRLACAHIHGRISVWNSEKWEQVLQVAIPTYGVSAMALSLGKYLWTGYRTGMIYVYDISSDEQWKLVKMWQAHQGPITMFTVDELSLLSASPSLDEKPLMQVISADQQGNVSIWDGLLSDYQKDQHMKELEETYCDYRKTRIQISTWNIDALSPDTITGQDKALVEEWLTSMRDADIIVVGLQEIVDLESKRQTARSLFLPRKKQDKFDWSAPAITSISNWSNMDAESIAAAAAIPQYSAWRNHITSVLQERHYTLLKTEHLVGLFSLVFIKHDQQMRAKDCRSTVVKTGLKVMNKCWHGNKGAVAIRFALDDSSVCFVNCHLAAGQSRAEQRNADADGIFKSAKFKKDPGGINTSHNNTNGLASNTNVDMTGGDDDTIILDHEHCFVLGDLNYRIDGCTRKDVLEWLALEDRTYAYRELQLDDQLNKQRKLNPLLKLAMFQEAPIRFEPTYKYDPGTDTYDTSDKQRAPAWCDRILFRTPETTCTHAEFYRRHEVKASDHRPVSAGFEVAIKTVRRMDCEKTARVVTQAWEKQLETIIQDCKSRYITDYEKCTLDEAINQLKTNGWNVQHVIDYYHQDPNSNNNNNTPVSTSKVVKK
ncbi:Endonuclease/exonuclease/phosphatase [Phascolomyces articulosus]|uniref:Endonuclease/exonuclease/phosphatase n=1 Tax=Phascolomyces articulosus TaxID=60185 RepID=A0AAD5K7N7_9FUNG|nr:Endonuclease/exonuclease/phosphatase [Phascolomyces articulosus]